MKTQIFRYILYSIIASLTCLNLTAASSPPSGENGVHFCGFTEHQSDPRRYARSLANLHVGEPRMVRLIYFLPSDRAPEQDIDTKLDTMIKNVQKFYADEMERMGSAGKPLRLKPMPTEMHWCIMLAEGSPVHIIQGI